MPLATEPGRVSEDVTLDAFADEPAASDTESTTSDGDPDSEPTTATDDQSSTATDGDSVTTDAASVASDGEDATGGTATVTSSWRANATCSACGEPTARRWWNGDERVCAECTSWTTTGRGACDQ